MEHFPARIFDNAEQARVIRRCAEEIPTVRFQKPGDFMKEYISLSYVLDDVRGYDEVKG